jgi:hypothetical protein
MSKINWIDTSKELPKFNGEYLVVWNLKDNAIPLTSCMEFELDSGLFIDVFGGSITKYRADSILFWAEYPPIPESLSLKYKSKK